MKLKPLLSYLKNCDKLRNKKHWFQLYKKKCYKLSRTAKKTDN